MDVCGAAQSWTMKSNGTVGINGKCHYGQQNHRGMDL